MQRFGTAFLDYWKRADKLLWLVMLAISGYSLILLKTIPNSSGRSYRYFAIQGLYYYRFRLPLACPALVAGSRFLPIATHLYLF